MNKIFYFVSVVFVSGLVGVDSLQCYVCNNCTNPTDADLLTCGDLVTPSPSSTASSAATTASSGATTASTAATTAPSVATTDSSAVNTTTPGTESTLGSDSVDPSPEGTRSKRNIVLPFRTSKSNGCNCRNEADCECDDYLFSNRMAQYVDEVPYVCYKVIEASGVIYRGCGPATWQDGKALCESEIAKNLTSCSTCNTDKCNGSFITQYSAFMLVTAIAITLFK